MVEQGPCVTCHDGTEASETVDLKTKAWPVGSTTSHVCEDCADRLEAGAENEGCGVCGDEYSDGTDYEIEERETEGTMCGSCSIQMMMKPGWPEGAAEVGQ